MESALYGIYALVVFVSEILLVRFLIRQQLVRKYRTPALSMKYSLFPHCFAPILCLYWGIIHVFACRCVWFFTMSGIILFLSVSCFSTLTNGNYTSHVFNEVVVYRYRASTQIVTVVVYEFRGKLWEYQKVS